MKVEYFKILKIVTLLIFLQHVSIFYKKYQGKICNRIIKNTKLLFNIQALKV